MTDYIEFAKIIKEKYPQYKDVDDLTLAQKVVEIYPEYKEKVTFESVKDSSPKAQNDKKKGIDLTPSGLYKGSQDLIASALAAPAIANKKNISVGEAFNQNREKLKEHRANNPTPIQDLVVDLAGYMAIPTPNAKATGIARAGQFLGQAALQGGIPAALETLKNGGNVGKGVTIGTGIAGILQGLAPVAVKTAKVLEKPVKYITNKAVEGLTDLKPETIAQVIKPTSKALDLSEKEAQNLLMNTTEGIRDNYKNLLQKKGDAVGNLLNELPNDKTFTAEQLLNNYDSILNNYSLSKNAALNPARNATQKELGKIEDLIYGDASGNLDKFKDTMDAMKYEKGKLQTVTNRYKNQYYKRATNDIGNDIEIANRRFNDEILGNLKQHPEWINDPQKIEALEKQINSYSVPEDYAASMYDKFYNAIGKGDMLDKAKNKILPKELYDINKNISNMIDWDKPGAQLKNDVLEQIYLSNAKKLSDLSPELSAANKAYSDLMDFQKNEGIRRILNNQNNIDSASSALKNYNSTVTKGNSNRNIQDLEKLLVSEGYEPFLNNIDDVNAAMDLLTQPKTGRNFLGAQTLAKGLVTPILKGIRNANAAGAIDKLQNIKEVLNPLGKLFKTGAGRGVGDMLQGGVEYNDYQ